jgi:hypothetical protein
MISVMCHVLIAWVQVGNFKESFQLGGTHTYVSLIIVFDIYLGHVISWYISFNSG